MGYQVICGRQKFTIRCQIRETINNIQYVTLQKKTQVQNAEVLYARKIPDVSPGFIVGGSLYSEGYLS